MSVVVLTFNAPVALLEDTVVAVAADGRQVTAEESLGPDGLVVTADFGRALDAGSWTVAWRVLATDSHPRTGSYGLDVVSQDAPDPSGDGDEQQTPVAGATETGDPAAAGPPPDGGGTTSAPASAQTGLAAPSERVETLERLGALMRVVLYLGLLVAAGLAIFAAGPRAGMRAHASRLAGVAFIAAVVGAAAGVAEVALHVAAVSGRGGAGLVHVPTWRAVLGTGLGPALLLRTVGLVLLAVGARRRIREALPSAADGRKLLGALVAISSFQFVGHTASAGPEALVRSADAVHAIAAAVWIGGLVGLALTARTASRERAVTVGRFSNWASAAVVGVTVAGSALAWVNLPTVAAAWQTAYGRLLLAKLVLVGMLLLLGAHNHFNLVPDVEAGHDGAVRELRRVVRGELLLVVGVVILTAILVNVSPT